MIKSILIGIASFLLFIGFVSATTYECDSCDSCTTAIAGASTDDIIEMNSSIILGDSNCINVADNITFDCKGFSITNNETGGTSALTGGSVENVIVQNCTFFHVYQGVVITEGNNNKVFNTYCSDIWGNCIALKDNDNSYIFNVSSYNPNVPAEDSGNLIHFSPDSAMEIRNIIIDCNGGTLDSGVIGIFVGFGNNATISNCNINNQSEGGIKFEGFNDTFAYNNLFNNTVNVVLIDSDNTLWNTTAINGTNIVGGSQKGGNFWGYPNGTGYSQTCDNADNDSFCDSPYSFNPTDYLPLTNNWSYEEPELTISWNTPANNSFTLNLSSILWNATIGEAPNTCTLNINDSANYSMLITGNYCYYTTSNLTNQTTYCGRIYANNSVSNVSSLHCATINLTSYIPPEPEPTRLIDNLGIFSSVALLVIGAGILIFLIGILLEFGIRNLKTIIIGIIGTIIFVALMLSLL